MLRAQHRYLSGVTYLLAGLIVMSGFSFSSNTASLAPQQAKAATDPSKCQIDITFVIDNSGSMNDHGADRVLKEILRPKLSDYFAQRGFSGDRGALFTYSYETGVDWDGFPNLLSQNSTAANPNTPKAKKHVLYNEDRSIQRALGTLGNNGIRTLNWNAPESFIGVGITAASNYARSQSQLTGRTQFIFIAGDEQTSGIDGIENRIRNDGLIHGIKYYTFALRKEISAQPYKKIAQISAQANDSEPRFYRGNGFQDSLTEDMDKDCISGDPSVQFCVTDADTSLPIGGAYLDDKAGTDPEYILTGEDHAPDPDTRRLKTGADGCTNPNFINHDVLEVNRNYTVRAVKDCYIPEIESWTYSKLSGQIVPIVMNSDCGTEPSTIKATVDKSGNPSFLNPGSIQTTVEVSFTVDLGPNKEPVTNVNLFEELDSVMVFDATPNFRLVKPDNSEVTITPVPGSLNQARKKVTLPLDTLNQEGDYILKFAGRYTGPADNVSRAIDVVGTCGNVKSGSRIEFKKGDSTDGCVVIPDGSITQSDGNKITLESDVLFGNKSLVLNDKLQLGVNGNLIVTGQTVTGNTGTSIVFDRNNVPTAGKLSWNALKTNISSQVDRWIRTKAVKEWTCPGGTLTIGQPNTTTMLYLNSDKENPTQPPSPFNFGQKSFTMWQLKNPAATSTEYNGCNIEMYGTIMISGTGTLVNKGGQAFIHGSITQGVNQPANRYLLGYVGFQQPGVAGSGQVVVYDQSSVKAAIIYTEGLLELGTIDTGIPSGSVTAKTHQASFIGRTMRFPPLGALRANITLGVFPGKNAFPPFVQTYLPKSEAAP